MAREKGKRKRLHILVSAGPTREPLDPVRFISNYATGFLGYALAREAKKRGHRVILISGPTALACPQGVRLVPIETARQLQRELARRFAWCDCLLMTAAVGDFRAQKVARQKIKRGAGKELTLTLKQNPDILAGLTQRKGRRLVVGFALETEELARNAWKKLDRKKLDLIVATQIKTNTYPFGETRLDLLILDKRGHRLGIKKVGKRQLARILLDIIERGIL